jgi:hypothetical protein
MALVLSGSINISGSMTATTIIVSSPGSAGMVSSSAQITELAPLMAYTASLKGAAIVSSSQQITNYYKFAETASANTFYGNQSISGSLRVTGSLKVGDWQHGEGVANTAKLDIRTASDRGLKINGASSSDVIITAYRGASDDMVRSMRLEGNAINIYIGDGNANTGSSVASFNTNGLGFESGKGIDFSATSNGSGTMTSELLNDYEEGTWTPVIEGETTNPTITGYSTQVGRYTKIGRVVTIHCGLQPSGTSVAGTGNLRIGGLPFTSANISDVVGTGVAASNGDFNWGSGKTQLNFSVGPNNTKIFVWAMQNGTTEAGVPVNNFNNSNQYLLFSLTYMAT